MSLIQQQNAHTIKYMYSINYHFSPACFGAYCTIFRENFFVCSKYCYILWLHGFATLYSYLKNHVCFNVELQILEVLVRNTSESF